MLEMWTVYDHPSDYPDHFVARCWLLDKPTDRYLFAKTLPELRKNFEDLGLYCQSRYPEDDPSIVEVWF